MQFKKKHDFEEKGFSKKQDCEYKFFLYIAWFRIKMFL